VGGSGPSYYYSNTVTDPVFPPMNTTVVPGSTTEVIEPTTPVVVPPLPVDPSQIGSIQPTVDGSTSDTLVSQPAPPTAG
jgi:hypothetical protein